LPINAQAAGITVTLEKGQNLELLRDPHGRLSLKLYEGK